MLSQKIKGAERFLTRPIGCESRAPHSRIKLCYLESGEFSRGKESIRADGGVVMVGNFDVDVQHQQRVGHLFGPLPPDMRHDTAFMDRIHGYVPGRDLPKVSRDLLTDHFGLVSDFLSECWNRLRRQSRQSLFQGRVHLGGALSGRDTTGVQKTISGLIKLVSPNPDIPVPDEVLEWALRIALECRRRVKEQQKRIGSAEFRNTQFSYSMGEDGVEKFVATPELFSASSISSDPLPPGQVWVISPGVKALPDSCACFSKQEIQSTTCGKSAGNSLRGRKGMTPTISARAH